MFNVTRRSMLRLIGMGGSASITGCMDGGGQQKLSNPTNNSTQQIDVEVDVDRIAADPADVPDPVTHDEPKHHDIQIETEELTAELRDGVTFDYMTFDGQVPGPMYRVRRGDTITVSLKNPESSKHPHNIDFHAVYGTGGGAKASMAMPGETQTFKFKCEYPGAFIYHCAVPNLDQHISAGMFGMILVEPEEGLPEVDREFYLGQHEVYTDKTADAKGHHSFSFEKMKKETPTYVLFNGEWYPFTPDRYGRLEAEKGEKIRTYLVTGGPNLTSNFHPIGNVWTKAWPNGSVKTDPDEYVQTMKAAPGSTFIGDMDTPVPETIKLVDHALTRVARQGLMAEIDVSGQPEPDIFDPQKTETKSENTDTSENESDHRHN
ncbi:MAG: copper-containing nitrite reductase [Halobacteria archaeon]